MLPTIALVDPDPDAKRIRIKESQKEKRKKILILEPWIFLFGGPKAYGGLKILFSNPAIFFLTPDNI
jgi:hypothetical protein